MTNAYPEQYLNSVTRRLAGFFDCALVACGMREEDCQAIFLAGRLCYHLERGDVLYAVGKSGIELFLDCYEDAFGRAPGLSSEASFDRSPQYWAGWALGYYQWSTARSFHEILDALSLRDVLALYPTLHEADITKFAEVAEQVVRTAQDHTRLRTLRDTFGLTQRQLSDRSGVSLRSVQMYEQRNKDINKAQASSVLRLARALGCTMEDLLEKGA